MKLRMIAIVGGVLLAGSLSAQTLTDVINEFNDGVAKVNNQEYDASLVNFNQVLTLAETVGDSASEMKASAEKLIPVSNYKQARLFLKRKQYDNAIPYLQKTIETATAFNNNAEIVPKANRYLLSAYFNEGQRFLKNKQYDDALNSFDSALELNKGFYHAHRGKALVYKEMEETESMLMECGLAKEGALAKNDEKTLEKIKNELNSYYKKIIDEEYSMVDPEEKDYSYVIEVCETALEANSENGYAYFRLAEINNKMIEYDAAIENSFKALQFEKDPVLISGINYQLGLAYNNTAEYDKACEALQKVVEEPFLSKAEKKIESVGCN